jgi:hypothetical protein
VRKSKYIRIGMGFGDPVDTKSTSGGWWRLLAGIVGVLAATLGFGFYLPLRQGNQLLMAEYTQARQASVSLNQELASVKAALASVQAERDELAAFKTSHDAALAANKLHVAQTVNSLPAPVQAAVSAARLKLRETPSALHVEVVDPTLFTPRADGLTKTGRSLLCQIITQGQSQGLNHIGVRTFAPPTRTNPGESRWAEAERLATGVADLLSQKCGIRAEQLTISSALAVPGTAPLRLELGSGD